MTTGRRASGLKRGDVILVPFPFAELTATRSRPAVVVSGDQYHRTERKIIVAAITSNIQARTGPTNFQLTEWRKSGLLKPSVVTCWLATLSPALVLVRIGALSGPDLQTVASKIRLALGV
ncbi:MAG: type II toxin-antitoxin system PemK/MazF family toxin [Acidobacteria bacterium]|nr:type II toxin-antitoxin system PemK/MazF family toxin [Acidobacteriota bacterium]